MPSPTRGQMCAPARFRLIAILLCVSLLALTIPPGFIPIIPTAEAVSPDIVISQVYGGGGNANATYNHDYVELFNRGASPVSLAGKSVQYTSATGTGNFSIGATLSGTLQPGQYYLVRMATNNVNVGTPVPTPDATGTSSMSATDGKVAVVNSTSNLPCNGGSDTCSAGELALIIDLVGYGSANFFEGAGAAPAISAILADFRAAGGCTDTDNNNADFAAATPAPRNTASTFNVCSGATPTPTPVPTPALSINDVSQAEGNAGQTAYTFTVSLSPANTTQTVTVNYATANGTTNPATGGATCGAGVDYISTNGTLTFAANDTSEQLTVQVCGDTTTESNETFFVNLSGASNAGIADAQGVGTIQNDDIPLLLISQVQGSTPSGNANSPRVGETVSVRGILTLLKSNGFFLQEEVSDNDSDPNTSEGIFVFVNATPTTAVGNQVTVTGTVAEFNGLTEISTSNANVITNNTGNAPPTAVTLTPADLPANVNYLQPQLEKYEGMRLSAASLTTVTHNDNFFDVPAVLTGQPRPLREPGIPADNTVPPDPTSGTPDPNIPRFDLNPEQILIDTNGRAGSTGETLTSKVVITNLTGPLDYAFNAYRIINEAPLTRSANMSAVPVPTPSATEFTVAGFNVENFDNNATQRQKAALAIVRVLRLPDIIGHAEIFDLASLQALATEANTQAVADGHPNPMYEARLIPTPVAGITQNVGFLVKTARVRIDGVTQERTASTYIQPSNGQPDETHDRPPLVLRATVEPTGANKPVIVVVNHTRSFIEIELVAGDGLNVRAKRKAQAEDLAGLFQELQTNNPGVPVIAVGDYNAFEFNNGYDDPISVMKGTPRPDDQIVVDQSPDLVNPNFVNLIDNLPADERYTFIFDEDTPANDFEEMTAQVLDHVLVNTVANAIYTRIAVARMNADFPEVPAAAFASDPTRPERNSDHDAVVSYYSLGAAQAPVGQLIISEMSPRGIIGSLDEFVEVYNNTDTDHTVAASDASGGYGIAAEDGILRCTIPNGTIIPARGHFLCGGAQYAYFSEVPVDAYFSVGSPTFGDIGDSQGVALFTSATNFSAGTLLDAFGYTTSPALYREGTGYPVAVVVNLPHSYPRTQYGGYEQDTNSNSADFISVNSRLDVCCDPQSSLGMPGPQNLTSPRVRLGQQPVTLFDPGVGASTAPNRERNATVVPNGQNGTLRFRRTITNNTAAPVTRLRIRVVDITTLNSPTTAQPGKPTPCFAPCADLRVLSSSDEAAVATSTGPKPTSGTTLDFSSFQPLGGGYNSSLTVNQVTGGSPLAPTTSVNVNMLVGIMRGGTARFFFFVEALP